MGVKYQLLVLWANVRILRANLRVLRVNAKVLTSCKIFPCHAYGLVLTCLSESKGSDS